MAQGGDLPKKKPETESKLTTVPGSYAAPWSTLDGPGGCLSVSLSFSSLLAAGHTGLLRAPRMDLA